MNCYDCAIVADSRDAVAVCADCGAGVCIEHAVSSMHWLTRTHVINRLERVEPPARVIRCGTCHAARGDFADAVPTRSTAHSVTAGRS